MNFVILKSIGVPGYLLRSKPINTINHIQSFVNDKSDPPKSFSQNMQKKMWRELVDRPTSKKLFCIASEHNDLLAKLSALEIVRTAYNMGTRSLWHIIVGGYKDKLLNRMDTEISDFLAPPKMLILSNVVFNSTQTKKEKLRDLLELYSESTRIVVITGTNPVAFFNDLGVHLNGFVMLQSKAIVQGL